MTHTIRHFLLEMLDMPSGLQSVISSLERVLSPFASVVSVLATFDVTVFVCFTLHVIFHDTMLEGQGERCNQVLISVAWGVLFSVSLIVSHLAGRKVSSARAIWML